MESSTCPVRWFMRMASGRRPELGVGPSAGACIISAGKLYRTSLASAAGVGGKGDWSEHASKRMRVCTAARGTRHNAPGSVPTLVMPRGLLADHLVGLESVAHGIYLHGARTRDFAACSLVPPDAPQVKYCS